MEPMENMENEPTFHRERIDKKHHIWRNHVTVTIHLKALNQFEFELK